MYQWNDLKVYFKSQHLNVVNSLNNENSTYDVELFHFGVWTITLPIVLLIHKKANSHIPDFIKLRMEMGNVSKRQQPDQRAENSRRPPMGLQYSEKI